VTTQGILPIHQLISLPGWGWAVLLSVVLSPVCGYAWHIWRDDEDLAPPGAMGPNSAPVPAAIGAARI
jgi:hypothetical protein